MSKIALTHVLFFTCSERKLHAGRIHIWNWNVGLNVQTRNLVAFMMGKTRFLIRQLCHFVFYAYDLPGQRMTFLFSLNQWSRLILLGNLLLFNCCCEVPSGFFENLRISFAKMYQVSKLLAFILLLQSMNCFPFVHQWHSVSLSLSQIYRQLEFRVIAYDSCCYSKNQFCLHVACILENGFKVNMMLRQSFQMTYLGC